ncbi:MULTISPECIES: hypothetical protein [Bosea]|uniref:hypothetical protein n=1 Tax=Bosea TaxID=85413 RepID=UPI000B01A0FB|nr:hypothetical protein [Bosea vaviloviae]
MHPLTEATLAGTGTSQIDLGLEGGYRATLFLLDDHLARFLAMRPDGLARPRTWSLSPRDRLGRRA